MIRLFRASFTILALLLVACGGSSTSYPTAVTGFTVTPGDTQVVVTWDSHPGQYYDLYFKVGSDVTVSDFDGLKLSITSPYTLTNLTNKTQYSFILTATNSGGVPGPPTPVVTTTLGASGTGVAWTIGTPVSSAALLGAAFGGNTFVAVGESAAVYSAQNSTNSTGGVTAWTRAITVPLAGNTTLASVAFDGSHFVALSRDGSVITSNDTVTWLAATAINTGNAGQVMYGIAYGGGTYVAVGAGGAIATNITSPPPRDPWTGAWTVQTSGTTQDLYGVAYVNGDFIAVGTQGTLLTSHDGVIWTPRVSHTSQALYRVAYGVGTYVAVGDGGTIVSSTDAATWSAQTSPTTKGLYAIVFGGNDQFVAAGDGGTIVFSDTGTNDSWTTTTAGTADLFGIASGGVFVAVGAAGANVSGR